MSAPDPGFAAVFAREPGAVRRPFLPGPRVWAVLGSAGAVAAVVLGVALLGASSSQRPARTEALPVGLATASFSPAPSRSAPASARPSSSPVSSVAPSRSAAPPSSPPTATRRPTATVTPTKSPPAKAGSKTTAPADSIPGRALVSAASGLCLSAGAGTDGSALIIAKCDGSAVQHWEQLGDGTLRSVGLCMDAAWASTDDLTQLQVAHCNGGAAQKWRVNATEDLVGAQSGKCADVWENRTAPGTPIKLWPCTGGANSTWRWK